MKLPKITPPVTNSSGGYGWDNGSVVFDIPKARADRVKYSKDRYRKKKK